MIRGQQVFHPCRRTAAGIWLEPRADPWLLRVRQDPPSQRPVTRGSVCFTTVTNAVSPKTCPGGQTHRGPAWVSPTGEQCASCSPQCLKVWRHVDIVVLEGQSILCQSDSGAALCNWFLYWFYYYIYLWFINQRVTKRTRTLYRLLSPFFKSKLRTFQLCKLFR